MITATMNAVVLTGHGGLDKLEILSDYPTPTAGPGEVLIEVRACGLNNTDIWVREGAYGTDENPDEVASWRRGQPNSLTFPRIQGGDIAGYIVEVGSGVSRSRQGERVMVDFSLYNTETESMAYIDYIGHGRDGGYADYCVVPAENAYVVDNDLHETELATFCCAYLTAEHMLDRVRVKKGETVVVTGASGGVGSGLIQLCRARGAIPVAISSSGYEERLTSVGAEAVLIRNSNSLSLQFESAMPGRSVDVIADLVGGELFPDLINLLKPEGRYICAGAIAGPVVPLDLRTVYLKHLELHGSSQGSRAAFSNLLGYIRTGKVQPLLDRVYALSQIHRAQQDFISKQFFGKLVVVPDRFYDASKPQSTTEVLIREPISN